MSSSNTPRGPRGLSRGGITKSRSPRPSTDRDGDLNMGTAGSGVRGRGRGRGMKSTGPVRSSPYLPPGHKSRAERPTSRRTEIKTEQLQKALATQSPSRRIPGLSDISVAGWRETQDISKPEDSFFPSFIGWLEKKASTRTDTIKITKHRVEGDALIISVKSALEERFLHLNNFEWKGVPLKIAKCNDDSQQNGQTTPATKDVKAQLISILQKRYDGGSKILNLAELGQDQDLQSMGILGNETTVKKFFPALMKMADTMFETDAKKRDMVVGVTLANNDLPDLELVTTLASTFPDLKSLDLSNNKLDTMDAMKRWRWKFRGLENIILTGNSVDQLPDTRNKLLVWYPKLSSVNMVPVTPEEIAAQRPNPIPNQPGNFADIEGIAAKFLMAFFPLFDSNKEEAIRQFYDQASCFSHSINKDAPGLGTPRFDHYMKGSRNLKRITHIGSQMGRLMTGADKILEDWNTYPPTRHPSLETQGDLWLVECHPIPGLPHPNGDIKGGHGGLIIMTHSAWEEIDPSSSKPAQMSFDRTFVLGPGGPTGFRVISDILCIRPFAGSAGWQVQVQAPTPAAAPPAQAPAGLPQHFTDISAGFGQPGPDKTEATVNQEKMVLEIRSRTGLKSEWATMCLEGNGWNMDAAFLNFQQLKAEQKIPAEAYTVPA